MKSKVIFKVILRVVTLAMVFAVNLAPADTMKGRVLGEQCAKLGKIGECYLQWAEPMVFWTQEGDYFQIKLAGKDLDQVDLDKAYGLEVEVEGKVLEQGKDKGKIEVAKLTILNPPGKKEFFKG